MEFDYTNFVVNGMAFLLIMEGITPLTSPKGWRQFLAKLSNLSDKHPRMIGLAMVAIGGCVLYFYNIDLWS